MSKTFVFILDFTYDGKKVVALEMGDFFKSGTKGIDKFRKEQNQLPLHDEYRKMLRQRYPTAIYIEDTSTSWSTSLKFHDFSNNFSALCNFQWKGLVPNLLYSRAALGAQYQFDRPIVASFESVAFPPGFRTIMSKLQSKQNTPLDILNYPKGVLIDACQDKVVFNRFTYQTGFCPATMLIDLSTLSFEDIDQFISDNPSSHYVIKPTNMSLGSGVEIADAKNIIALIRKLQTIGNEFERFDRNESFNLSIWKDLILHKGNHFLLLQTCCPSKEIKHEGKTYRPTARAVIEVTFDDDVAVLPTLEFLGSYWKFPVKESTIPSTQSLVSHVEDDTPTTLIDPSDWEQIERQLKSQLPPILMNLYSTEFDSLSTHFESSAALKNYQKILKIDEKLKESHHKIPAPNASDALRLFKEFTYGGPGFTEHLEHFKNAICTESSEVKSSEQSPKIAESVVGGVTFFKPNDDNHTLAKNEKSELDISY